MSEGYASNGEGLGLALDELRRYYGWVAGAAMRSDCPAPDAPGLRRAMQHVHDRIKDLDPDGSIYGAWCDQRRSRVADDPGPQLRLVR